MNKFGLDPQHYLWIKKILSTFFPGSKVFVFGSRARGDFKRYSDLDLAIQLSNPAKAKTWQEVQEQFSESRIPIKIDLVELDKIDPDFRQSIDPELKQF